MGKETHTSHKQPECKTELSRARHAKRRLSGVPEASGRFLLEKTIHKDYENQEYGCNNAQNRGVREQGKR
jgi:hypothetical protein